jgi:iron complex outermembrane receptor protein
MLNKDRSIHPLKVVKQYEIEQQASRDIGDYLRSTPNISGIRKGGGAVDPVIRGFKYKQLGVIVNGGTKIEGGCPNRMDPAVAHIDIDDIERIEVFKGPYALKFGPSFGGYINLKTVKPFPGHKFHTEIRAIKGFESNWNGNKEHLMIKGGNKHVYFAVSGNHKKYGNYKAGNGKEISSGFTRYNYKGQLGISPDDNHNIMISYDRSYGRNMMFPALPMDERSDDTHLSNIEYNYLNDSHKVKRITLKAYNSDVHHIMDNKERPFSDTVVAVSDIKAMN